MEHLIQCPVCDCKHFLASHTIIDHFLTKEEFQIVRCEKCGFLFTNPRPEKAESFKYYQSAEYFSHSKNKTGWLGFAYDALRSVALRRKFELITKHKSNERILDIGCGTGEFLNLMKAKGWEVTGVEPAANPREFAIKTYDINVFDESKLDELKPSGFDVITLWHVLEHVPDLNQRISQINRLLSDEGLLVVALPNVNSWDATHYKNFWAAWDVPRHLYHFSKETFDMLIKKHNLKIISIHPMKFDAYYISLLSEKYMCNRNRLFAALFNGFRSNISAKRNRNNYSSLIYLIKKHNI
jgi:2-polyprenyl-3-methyl-5-hydroxy-6-metoxy-1,4-benzoquinol methylase